MLQAGDRGRGAAHGGRRRRGPGQVDEGEAGVECSQPGEHRREERLHERPRRHVVVLDHLHEGLQLGVGDGVVLHLGSDGLLLARRERNDLGEGRDGAVVVVGQAVVTQVLRRLGDDRTRAVGGAVEGVVVHHHELVVRRQLQVELEDVRLVRGVLHGGQAVLRDPGNPSTPMPQDRRGGRRWRRLRDGRSWCRLRGGAWRCRGPGHQVPGALVDAPGDPEVVPQLEPLDRPRRRAGVPPVHRTGAQQVQLVQPRLEELDRGSGAAAMQVEGGCLGWRCGPCREAAHQCDDANPQCAQEVSHPRPSPILWIPRRRPV